MVTGGKESASLTLTLQHAKLIEVLPSAQTSLANLKNEAVEKMGLGTKVFSFHTDERN